MPYPQAVDTMITEDPVCLNDDEKWLLIDTIAELIAEGKLTDYSQLRQQKSVSERPRSRGP